jgi:hypothetical protein
MDTSCSVQGHFLNFAREIRMQFQKAQVASAQNGQFNALRWGLKVLFPEQAGDFLLGGHSGRSPCSRGSLVTVNCLLLLSLAHSTACYY